MKESQTLEADTPAAEAQIRMSDIHPEWCSREHDVDANGTETHWRDVAGGWMPETRRATYDDVVTRPYSGQWSVAIAQLAQKHPHDVVEDHTVRLMFTTIVDEFALLPGEARELAAALVRAADLVLFGQV